VYWMITAYSAAGSGGRHQSLDDAGRALVVIVSFGAPVAYAATLIGGGALWMLARRNAFIGLAPTAATGALLGALVSLVLAPSLRGELFSVPLPLWLGALLGVATAVVWWTLARGNPDEGR
jgi:hypothetical protein